MSLLAANLGDLEILRRIVSFEALRLKLYTNAHTPTKLDSLGSLTEAATSTGYAPITLGVSSWTIGTTNGTINIAIYAPQTFGLTTAGTFCGYMITNAAGTIVLWAEVFSNGPYSMGTDGGNIRVTPNIQAN